MLEVWLFSSNSTALTGLVLSFWAPEIELRTSGLPGTDSIATIRMANKDQGRDCFKNMVQGPGIYLSSISACCKHEVMSSIPVPKQNNNNQNKWLPKQGAAWERYLNINKAELCESGHESCGGRDSGVPRNPAPVSDLTWTFLLIRKYLRWNLFFVLIS